MSNIDSCKNIEFRKPTCGIRDESSKEAETGEEIKEEIADSGSLWDRKYNTPLKSGNELYGC